MTLTTTPTGLETDHAPVGPDAAGVDGQAVGLRRADVTAGVAAVLDGNGNGQHAEATVALSARDQQILALIESGTVRTMGDLLERFSGEVPGGIRSALKRIEGANPGVTITEGPGGENASITVKRQEA